MTGVYSDAVDAGRSVRVEGVADLGTDWTYYVRQGRRGCGVPRGEATVNEPAVGATPDPERTETPESG